MHSVLSPVAPVLLIIPPFTGLVFILLSDKLSTSNLVSASGEQHYLEFPLHRAGNLLGFTRELSEHVFHHVSKVWWFAVKSIESRPRESEADDVPHRLRFNQWQLHFYPVMEFYIDFFLKKSLQL